MQQRRPAASVPLPPTLSLLLSPRQLRFSGIMQYDGDLLLPEHYLVPPPDIERASEQYLMANGVSVFACSESQKVGGW